MKPTKRDEEMYALAMKLAKILEGENYFDCACVAALVCVYAVGRGFPEKRLRRKALDTVHKFMEERMADFD
jgi:hypothetical protein